MWHFCFRRRYSWFSFVLIISLLAGCTGNAEEDATAQAVVEQLISTNTPPPTATEPPPPTSTPLPPTETPPPAPSEVPPTPTDTPEPIPSPPSAPMVMVEDSLGDSYNCDTQAAVLDSEVDISLISATEQESSLILEVLLNSPLVNDYSFAVLLTLISGENLNYYAWEIHETVLRVGEIDSQTGELRPESANLQIDHDQAAGNVTFTIPLTGTAVISTTTTITSSTTISGTGAPLEQFYVASFHTPQEGEAKNCDTAGPYEYK